MFGNAILNYKFDFFYEKTYCRGGSRLNRLYKYLFVGAAGTTATPTNQFVGTAGNKSCPYKSICRGGLGTASTNAWFVETLAYGRLSKPPLQMVYNRPYKYFLT